MKNIIFILMFYLFLISCAIYGVTNDYNKLPQDVQERINMTTSFQNLNKQIIYEITGDDLLNHLKKYEKSIVYIFVNNCKSTKCLPISSFTNYARNNNYNLILIMDSYTYLKNEEFKEQFFSINSNHYETLNRNKYTNYFKKDITKLEEEDISENIFFFNKDSLVGKFNELPLN